MGEYHKRYIRSLFDTEEDYQNYINRKIHISWKSCAQTVFSGIYNFENIIDEKGTISNSDKEDIMDFFCNYAKERETEINNLKRDCSQLQSKEKTIENNYSKIVKQRNLAILFCIILFCSALFFAFNPLVQKNRGTTRIVDIQYVASVSSDKYHNLSCDYAKNIKEENKLYYETEEEARKAGKSPCSVCMP